MIEIRGEGALARPSPYHVILMVNEVPAVERSVQTIIAARCLERVADQTTNIAESVIFISKGVNIKHHCQE